MQKWHDPSGKRGICSRVYVGLLLWVHFTSHGLCWCQTIRVCGVIFVSFCFFNESSIKTYKCWHKAPSMFLYQIKQKMNTTTLLPLHKRCIQLPRLRVWPAPTQARILMAKNGCRMDKFVSCVLLWALINKIKPRWINMLSVGNEMSTRKVTISILFIDQETRACLK